MKKQPRLRPGLTLIEVVFALAILSTLVMTAYSITLRAYRYALSSKQRTVGQYALQNALESVRAYRADSDNFNWVSFVTSIRDINASKTFLVVPENNPATPTHWSVVSAPDNAATFNFVSPLSDIATYNIRIQASFYKGTATESDISQVDTVRLDARVEWVSATGVDSNAEANTFLTKLAGS
ncbi:prepilin-type N-terminal cleavage/methylation domain-containing protein [Candidatus Saccharibacteria bacterium]|nr:prepilin-type N-terminal cleavage/methylation domain-containing protein [Candidatus Saccharibacteria bacterium]